MNKNQEKDQNTDGLNKQNPGGKEVSALNTQVKSQEKAGSNKNLQDPSKKGNTDADNAKQLSKNQKKKQNHKGKGKGKNNKPNTSSNQAQKSGNGMKDQNTDSGKQEVAEKNTSIVNQFNQEKGDGTAEMGSSSGDRRSSEIYENKDAQVNYNEPKPQNPAQPALPLIGYNGRSQKPFILQTLDFNINDKYYASALNFLEISQSHSKNEFVRAITVKKLMKSTEVVIPPGVDSISALLKYADNAEGSHFFDYHKMNPFKNYKKCARPAIPEIINIMMLFNLGGYDAKQFSPLMTKVARDPDDFTFIKGEEAEPNFGVFGKYGIVKKMTAKSEQAFYSEMKKLGSTRRHLIASFEPTENQWDVLPIDLNFNSVKEKNKTILSQYLMDVGTSHKVISSRNLQQNIINLVAKEALTSNFRGLLKSHHVLLSFIEKDIQIGTFMRILFYCINKAKNFSGFQMLKKGAIDSTTKHMLYSVKNAQIQNLLKNFAGMFSQVPYDDRVFQMAVKFLEGGKLNSLGELHENNPYIAPVLLMANNFAGDNIIDLKKVIMYKAETTSYSLTLPLANLLYTLLKRIKNCFDFKYPKPDSLSFSNENQPPYFDQKDGDNDDLTNVLDAFTFSAHTITKAMYDAIISWTDDIKLQSELDDYFYLAHDWYKLYQTEGLFAGTDYKMGEIEIPNFDSYPKEYKIQEYPYISLLSSARLGEISQQIVTTIKTDPLNDYEYLPYWNLYVNHGSEDVKYSNLVGFLWVKHANKAGTFEKLTGANSLYDGKISIADHLYSVNLMDATISPFIPKWRHFVIGANYGLIASGEFYHFTDDSNVDISYLPMCFEKTTASSGSLSEINGQPSFPLLTNNDINGYYVSQSMIPFLTLARDKESIITALYSNARWNNLHYSVALGFDVGLTDLIDRNPGIAQYKISMAQNFRPILFNRLTPTNIKVEYDKLPKLAECILRTGN